MPQATESQIAMWRGAIALAWANDSLDEGGKQKLQAYFRENIILSDQQRAALTNEINQKIALKDVWGAITSPEDRAHLIDIAPLLFASHGGPTIAEKALYDKMLADQMASIDQSELHKDFAVIKARSKADQAKYESGYAAEFNNLGLIGKFIYQMDKAIGDIVDRIFPANTQSHRKTPIVI